MSDTPMIVHDPATANAVTHNGYSVYFEVPPMPGQTLLDTVGAGTLENFFIVGETWAHLLHHRLAPGNTTLDIGCGCGRTARFLLFRDDIRYVGFDVFGPAIEFCKRHLEPLSKGRFRFEHLDVFSAHYNPRGALQSTEVRFPAADGSVDIAFAASLFTHLLEPDAAHYLAESARCLKRGGLLIASIHAEPPKGVKFSGRENRIDIAMDHFLAMARAAGLHLQEDLLSICGQETLVLKRP